ncbi:15184_t:CDS:2, partial [Acaulospora morrowiae]
DFTSSVGSSAMGIDNAADHRQHEHRTKRSENVNFSRPVIMVNRGVLGFSLRIHRIVAPGYARALTELHTFKWQNCFKPYDRAPIDKLLY